MKVVINRCYGGFGLSESAVRRYCDLKGLSLWVENDGRFDSLCGPRYFIVPPEQRVEDMEARWQTMTQDERKAYNEACSKQSLYPRDIPRHDPVLVQVVEDLGGAASDRFADLKVVEIPDNVEYTIEEYDGMEHVAEVHRVWS